MKKFQSEKFPQLLNSPSEGRDASLMVFIAFGDRTSIQEFDRWKLKEQAVSFLSKAQNRYLVSVIFLKSIQKLHFSKRKILMQPKSNPSSKMTFTKCNTLTWRFCNKLFERAGQLRLLVILNQISLKKVQFLFFQQLNILQYLYFFKNCKMENTSKN